MVNVNRKPCMGLTLKFSVEYVRSGWERTNTAFNVSCNTWCRCSCEKLTQDQCESMVEMRDENIFCFLIGSVKVPKKNHDDVDLRRENRRLRDFIYSLTNNLNNTDEYIYGQQRFPVEKIAKVYGSTSEKKWQTHICWFLDNKYNSLEITDSQEHDGNTMGPTEQYSPRGTQSGGETTHREHYRMR